MKKAYVAILSALVMVGIFAFFTVPSSSDEPPNFGFVPNMGEASVSKVDLANNVAVARYYTAPRQGQVIDAAMAAIFGVTAGPFPVAPADWRTTRIAMDAKGNAWVINTGADCFEGGSPKYGFGIQGTIVRIMGNTTGLAPAETSQSHADILPFGTDKAVEVYSVGGLNDIPRTIVFDKNGYLWIGFHMAAKKWGYFQKYAYDECAKTLTAVGASVTSTQYDIAPYNCAIDKNGVIWFSSYGSSRVGRTTGTYGADHGMYSFNTNDPSLVITKYEMQGWTAPFPSGTAYGVLVDNSPAGANVKVYATSLEGGANLWVYDSSLGGLFTIIPISAPSNPGLRSMAFDQYGRVWIAGSSNNRAHWYNPSSGSSGYSGVLGTTPVGVGIDAAGDIWVVVRDSNKLVTFTPPATDPAPEFNGFINVPVGPQPYAYGDFTQLPIYYQICGYKYKAGTNPKLGLEGWTINLYKKVGDNFPTTPTATTTTDASGHYCFTNLEAGIYKVTETLKDSWHQVSPASGVHIITLPDTDPCSPIVRSYDFENTQTVCFDETAWAANEGPWTNPFLQSQKGNWATYAVYNFGSGTATNPKKFNLYAGQTYFVGYLLVYDEGGYLYLKYDVVPEGDPNQTYKPGYCPAPGWKLDEYHFQVVDEFSGFTPFLTKTGNPVPGRFKNNGQAVGDGWFKIAIAGYTSNNAYIAAHAVVFWCGYLCQ